MADVLDTLLFDDEPSAEERAALEERLEETPALAKTWTHWTRARAHLRERLEERLSDRRLLVLYVLDEEGDAGALTDSEQAALDAARDDLVCAIDERPALQKVVERIREERADFDTAWAEHGLERETAADVPSGDIDNRSTSGQTEREARAPRSREASGAARWSRRFALVSLVVGMAVGAFWLWPQSDSTTVTVAEGDTRVVDLGGGTTARLVGDATLTYDSQSNDQSQRVTLSDGRAFFDVTPRAQGASFVVETPTATAAVLGTQFGVTARTDTTQVVLASGEVRVEAVEVDDAPPVVLKPGQTSWVAKGGAPMSPTPTDLTTALDWTGLFIFRSVPMADIADRLGRHYNVEVTVADALADEPVTGTFERSQPVQEVLGALGTTLGGDVQRRGDAYYIVPGP
ncbi:MAG: iron dicitrate transport regulator FecR [Bacteroidetes bacterium SW_9_63_38]|nr:MAG: iron dicitrate transport regulator FecR [Bacteroidetes bacterium SW_9_63_38]